MQHWHFQDFVIHVKFSFGIFPVINFFVLYRNEFMTQIMTWNFWLSDVFLSHYSFFPLAICIRTLIYSVKTVTEKIFSSQPQTKAIQKEWTNFVVTKVYLQWKNSDFILEWAEVRWQTAADHAPSCELSNKPMSSTQINEKKIYTLMKIRFSWCCCCLWWCKTTLPFYVCENDAPHFIHEKWETFIGSSGQM